MCCREKTKTEKVKDAIAKSDHTSILNRILLTIIMLVCSPILILTFYYIIFKFFFTGNIGFDTSSFNNIMEKIYKLKEEKDEKK